MVPLIGPFLRLLCSLKPASLSWTCLTSLPLLILLHTKWEFEPRELNTVRTYYNYISYDIFFKGMNPFVIVSMYQFKLIMLSTGISVLVTGTSTILGASVARSLEAHGAHVVAFDSSSMPPRPKWVSRYQAPNYTDFSFCSVLSVNQAMVYCLFFFSYEETIEKSLKLHSARTHTK